jgi:hypothetical protein
MLPPFEQKILDLSRKVIASKDTASFRAAAQELVNAIREYFAWQARDGSAA